MENNKQYHPPKPTLTLLDGQRTNDLDALMKFYTTLTGKVPTEAELERCRKILDEAEGK